MANYLKGGSGLSRQHDEAMTIGKPLTPKSELRGSLSMSLQTAGGLCDRPKCVKKLDHQGSCWPSP